MRDVKHLVKIDVTFHCIFLFSLFLLNSNNDLLISSTLIQFIDKDSWILIILNCVSLVWLVLDIVGGIEVTNTGHEEIVMTGGWFITILFSVVGMCAELSTTVYVITGSITVCVISSDLIRTWPSCVNVYVSYASGSVTKVDSVKNICNGTIWGY